MKNVFLLLVWCSAVQASSVLNSLTEYRANTSYQTGDFKTAEAEYGKLLADSPYDVQNNYNIGITQYKQKKFDDAHQSFNRAVLHATPSSLMHEQALFNRANCLVQKNKLQDAVKDYKKVLQINPDNVPAKTNLAIIEKMLKEPPKKDQQQSKDKNNQKNNEQRDKNQESKDQDGQSDQNQSEQQQKDQADKQKNGDKGKNEQQQSNQQKEQEEQKEEQHETKEQQAEKLQKTKEEKSKSSKEQETKAKQEAQHKQSSTKSDKNQSTSSDSAGQNDDEQQVELHDALAQQMMEKPKDDNRLEKKSAILLDKLDEYEKNIQKKLLQMNVTKQGAQKHGQKNW